MFLAIRSTNPSLAELFDELKCRLAGAEDVVNMMEAAMMMFLMMKLVNGSGTTERMDE